MIHLYARILVFALITFFICSRTLGQETKAELTPRDTLWKKKGSFNLNLTNVGLSNWVGGGQSSIALGTLIDLNATRENKRSRWENYLNFALGFARVGPSGENLFKKTDDQLILGTKYGYKISPNWSLVVAVDLRTQALPGYTFKRDTVSGDEVKDQLISDFFAPAYLRPELGIEFRNKAFFARFSPLANRTTFVLNETLSNAGAFGVDPGNKIRWELGMNFNAGLEVKLMENVTFKSLLNLFANYQNPDLIDVNWDNFLVMKVNKFIDVAFTTQLFYDHDILIPQSDGTAKQAIQFKHVLAVNFGYKF